MKIITTILFLSIFATSVMAERINLPENTEALNLIMEQDFVQAEMAKIMEASQSEVELINISSKDVGIRGDLGLDEEFNSGNKHKFIFSNVEGSEQCSFSIYVIYQHTMPLSINKKYSEVTSEADCTKY